MQRIQVVLDKELLWATDEAARRTERSRSALVRDALREYLRSLANREKEERDCKGHFHRPATHEHLAWEAEADWSQE